MNPRICLPAAAAALLVHSSPILAEVKLPPIFSDHAVLQQGMSVPIWGTADAGEKVTVTFDGRTKTATTGADGKWMIRLAGLKAGGPFEMTVAGKNTISVKDVLVGEVWIASGQSNMQFPVSRSGPYGGLPNADQVVAAASFPKIRIFTGRLAMTYEPQTNVNGQWVVSSPESAPAFSAVSYLFARNLHQELKVPVGMITLAQGASVAEAWISRKTLAADPKLKFMLDSLDANVAFYRKDPRPPVADAPLHPTPINKPRTPVRQVSDPMRDQHFATILYNGMIAPVIPYAIRGVIWYQGESICFGTPGLNLYGYVQQTLVKDWRKQWGQGNFPFYIVQLPGQKNTSNNPRVREEQATILALPHTGMAVTIDTGEERNVHPVNKEPVCDRLARIALADAYGRKLEYSGPMFDSMKVVDNAPRLKFSHLGGGLIAKGAALKGFQIAGADRKFVDADAKIDGATLVVSSPQVSAPVAVRYAYDNYPEGMGCNLYNTAGLPAATFRTDHWEYHLDLVEN